MIRQLYCEFDHSAHTVHYTMLRFECRFNWLGVDQLPKCAPLLLICRCRNSEIPKFIISYCRNETICQTFDHNASFAVVLCVNQFVYIVLPCLASQSIHSFILPFHFVSFFFVVLMKLNWTKRSGEKRSQLFDVVLVCECVCDAVPNYCYSYNSDWIILCESSRVESTKIQFDSKYNTNT